MQKLRIFRGRSFASTSEYTEFLHRYEDLSAVETGDCLKNIKFIDARELEQAADLVGSTAAYHFQNAQKPDRQPAHVSEGPPTLLDAQLEIVRLTDELESRRASIGQ